MNPTNASVIAHVAAFADEQRLDLHAVSSSWDPKTGFSVRVTFGEHTPGIDATGGIALVLEKRVQHWCCRNEVIPGIFDERAYWQNALTGALKATVSGDEVEA